MAEDNFEKDILDMNRILKEGVQTLNMSGKHGKS